MAPQMLRKQRVYDPVLRLIHAWNGVLLILLLVSGWGIPQLEFADGTARCWQWHLWAGYGLVVGFSARFVWGLIGEPHARWVCMWHPSAWRSAIQNRRFFTAPNTFGHHPLASAMYVLVYLLLFGALVTGLALAAIDQNTGPLYSALGHDVVRKALVRAPHEWISYCVGLFVAAHLLALIFHARLHGVPMAQAMVNGDQYLPEVDLQHPRSS